MRSAISQLSIHKLEVFCIVAELGSVSRAAERLGIAQPVVSSHLKGLADKIGSPLIQRQGRRVVLTEAGQRVHRWAQGMVSRARELERELAESQRGTVGKANIGASMTMGSYVLPALIVGFHRDHPRGEVSVRVATPQPITDAVLSGDCDFAFTILDPRHETGGLEVERVMDEQLVLVVSDALNLAADALAPADLRTLPFVSAQYGTPRRELEDYLLRQHGVRRERIEMEFGHAEALKQAVRAGAGAAFLFRPSIRDELAAGTLREIGTGAMRIEAPVYQVRRRGKKLSRYQQLLMRHLAEQMRTGQDPADAASGQPPALSALTIAGE